MYRVEHKYEYHDNREASNAHAYVKAGVMHMQCPSLEIMGASADQSDLHHYSGYTISSSQT